MNLGNDHSVFMTQGTRWSHCDKYLRIHWTARGVTVHIRVTSVKAMAASCDSNASGCKTVAAGLARELVEAHKAICHPICHRGRLVDWLPCLPSAAAVLLKEGSASDIFRLVLHIKGGHVKENPLMTYFQNCNRISLNQSMFWTMTSVSDLKEEPRMTLVWWVMIFPPGSCLGQKGHKGETRMENWYHDGARSVSLHLKPLW